MNRPFECPDCGSHHDEPAEATYVLTVRCFDCELEMLYRADRDSAYEMIPRAA
jgi:acetone carboxylase gamma subunit